MQVALIDHAIVSPWMLMVTNLEFTPVVGAHTTSFVRFQRPHLGFDRRPHG